MPSCELAKLSQGHDLWLSQLVFPAFLHGEGAACMFSVEDRHAAHVMGEETALERDLGY